jgi:hypothetical protein
MLRAAISAAALSLLAAAPSAAQEAEAVSFDAFAIWSADGAVVETGGGAHAFAGSMSGPYFVDLGEGPIPAGVITCVGTLDAAADGRQTGAARCRLVAEDGAVAYGAFACDGHRLVGCTGRFALEGGEGRLAGVAGEGPIRLRRTATVLEAGPDGRISEAALGVASWKGFTLSAPAVKP